MFRALKYLFWLAVLGALGLAGYAILADLPPPTRDVVVDVAPPLDKPE